MITSLQNSYVKTVASLSTAKGRKKSGMFIVEGLKSIMELGEEWTIDGILYTEDVEKATDLTPYKTRAKKDLLVDEKVMKHLSDTMTPQGIMAVVENKTWQLGSLLTKEHPFLILLEEVQDPGNLGTIIRTADAAGADGVILSKGCADLYNPKVIRSTMGSLFHLPVVVKQDLADIIPTLQGEGVKVYAAHLEGATYPYSLDFKEGTALLIGNEGSGLTKEIADLAHAYVKLPMEGRAESLNASVAASILAYEVLRQRLIEG